VAGVVAALLAIQLLTRTGWGMEQARQFALGWLAERVHGTVTIGRVSGRGLLSGVVLSDVSIIDARGRPFLALDSAHASYDWRTLLAGQIVLDRVVLFRPRVHLEQLPGDTAWNYQYLFADTTPRDPTAPDRRTLVLFRQARIIAGEATVLNPVATDRPLEPADTARVILERMPGGLARMMRFRDIDAQLSQVLWESPTEPGRLFEVERVSGTGFVFRDPFTLRHAEGRLALRDSLVSLDFPRVELPGSTAGIFGTVVQARGQNWYDLQLDSDNFTFRDLGWISDRLPEDGGGSIRLRIQSQRASNSTLWFAENARIRTSGSSIAGSLGAVLGDTTYFTPREPAGLAPGFGALLARLLPGGPHRGRTRRNGRDHRPPPRCRPTGTSIDRLGGGLAGERWFVGDPLERVLTCAAACWERAGCKPTCARSTWHCSAPGGRSSGSTAW
jgi:hypothetical protein